jgi:hypothetical protein
MGAYQIAALDACLGTWRQLIIDILSARVGITKSTR